ncbi:MAG: hypothetical protein M3020_26185, partial [Myxococcota bacterium]|nr:hypothetical protein [Myxococcota bacterium]
VTTGVGFRAALRFQDTTDPEKITGDQSFDELYVEPRFSGKVTDVVGWTANFQGSGRTTDGLPATPGNPAKFELRVLDLVGQLDFMDEFHVWMGRMLTPADRANFSGPWFIPEWAYPGSYIAYGGGVYVGPRGTEEFGRETGVVAWGDIGGGKFKYYLSAMDLDGNVGADATGDAVFNGANSESPLFSGRLSYAILGSEPGFYGSSTYYGAQDIVAIGAAVQYQKDFTGSSGNTGIQDDVLEFNADLLAEYNTKGSGTVRFEGGYYHFDTNAMPMDDHFYVSAGYLTPENIGIGKLNPIVRFQMAKKGEDEETGPEATLQMIDAQLAYVMKDYFAKLMLVYTNGKFEYGDTTVKSNAVQLGFQIQQ